MLQSHSTAARMINRTNLCTMMIIRFMLFKLALSTSLTTLTFDLWPPSVSHVVSRQPDFLLLCVVVDLAAATAHTDRQTDRRTDRRTDKPVQSVMWPLNHDAN